MMMEQQHNAVCEYIHMCVCVYTAAVAVDSEGRNIATLPVQTSERTFVPRLEFNFVVRSRKRGNNNDDDEK